MEDPSADSPPAAPPDEWPCWDGAWQRVPTLTDVWAQSALVRTVDALPQLHPWRLGDAKGSARQLAWVARLGGPDAAPHGVEAPLGVLSVTSGDADLDRSDDPRSLLGDDLTTTVARWAIGALGSLAQAGTRPQWAGAMVRLPGTALPPVAWLPRALRSADDPSTSWATESVDFDDRYTVHADDLRTAAALLTPAVMAIALDDLPPLSALTVSGDAVHVWWPHRGDARRHAGRVARGARAAARLAGAFPHFVLAEFPDHSQDVEHELAERRRAAEAYRAARRPGTSTDPVLQRIYDQARAARLP